MLNERQKLILDLTEKNKRVSVKALAKKLYVSEMTIRRDLDIMSREGIIQRYHGGAIALEDYSNTSIEIRMHMYEKEKRSLASSAQKHISDGQTIFLNNSSTCSYIVPCLKNHKNITVVTNSVQFLLMLSKMGIKCLLAGGEYLPNDRCLVGRSTERFLREINTDIAFISCSGISDDGIVTEVDEATAEITKIAIANANKKILLADRSKSGVKYTYTVCRTEDMDDVIII